MIHTYLFSWSDRTAVFYAPSKADAKAQFEEQYNPGHITDLVITKQK